MSISHPDLIVVGGGIAGCAAALRAVQNGLRIAWILGDKASAKRSRGQWVANIDNMIGIHDGIVRKQVARELRGAEFAEARNKVESGHAPISTREIIENTRERVRKDYSDLYEEFDGIATDAKWDETTSEFIVTLEGRELRSPHVVLATGVMDRQPKIAKQKGDVVLDDPKWIYPFANRESVLYCTRCEGHLTREARAAVIGSSETAAQIALILYERHGSVCCLLTNGEKPTWSEPTARLIEHYGIGVRPGRLVDVRGSKGALQTLVFEDGEELPLNFALVSLGLHRAYNDLAHAVGAELMDPQSPREERHVRIDSKGETTIPGFFCVGDLAKRPDEPIMKQIYTAQEYAVRAVDTVDRRIRRARRKAILLG